MYHFTYYIHAILKLLLTKKKLLPERTILSGHHEMRASDRHEVHHTLVTGHGCLVAALEHGERLGDHQRPVHRGVEPHQVLQLLDAAGRGQKLHLAQISVTLST